MATKKTSEKTLPRIGPNEVFPLVGEAAEKLKALIPVFGAEIVGAVINAVGTGKVRHGELEIENIADPEQKLKAAFDNPDGVKDIKIKLSGNWLESEDINLDNPLFSPVKGIIYRKRAPADEKPIVEEGQVIEPNGAICAISQTKNNIWYLQLPPDKFPKGGILTKFTVADGKEVEKGETICYIKKVE
jgi:biotin carboxyl carrier protein